MQIDPKREVCRVVTMKGQKLDSVYWLRPYGGNDRQGDFFTPRVGDRVFINYGLGYPIIIGSLPRPQTGVQSYPIDISSEESLVDTGNYAPALSTMVANASKSRDSLLGDRLISSQGGGLLGLLRGGSVVLRSSRATEIFMTRLQDLIRVVSRNFEHFTDLGLEVIRNVKGRVYKYYGLAQTYEKTSQGTFNYHQYHGDVLTAESVKDQYHNQNITVPSASAEGSDLIFKEQVTLDSGVERMHRSLSLTGVEHSLITGDESFTRRRSTNGEIYASYKDENKTLINVDGIELLQRQGHSVVLHDDGITLTHSSGHVVKLDSGSISLDHSDGASTVLNGSGVYNTFSGHFCNVTSGGVQLG